MSLQTRLTALAQAVGADIKDLRGKIPTTISLDPWHTVGTSGQVPFPAGWGPASAIGQVVQFRKDPFGRTKLRGVALSKSAFGFGGTNSVIFTLPSTHLPAWPQDFEAIVTEPDGATNSVVQLRANTNGTIQIIGPVTLTRAGALQSGGTGTYVRLDGWEFDTDSVISYAVGPQGPKGDPGGVNVVTTYDWNTALTPNFYRSSNDPFAGTVNGPGDPLNPPPQAGIVAAHEGGRLVQRVWDLQMQVAYTRHRAVNGTWTAWAADLGKLPLWTSAEFGWPDPADGDERYFQNAVMKTFGVIWRFRYNASSTSPYKWEFVGGAPWQWAATPGAITGGTWQPIVASRRVMTFAGEYQVRAIGNAYSTDSGNRGHNIGVEINGALASAIDAGPSTGYGVEMVVDNTFTVAAAGQTIGFMVNSVSGTFRGCAETITPVRIQM